jgi:hypothetical protein
MWPIVAGGATYAGLKYGPTILRTLKNIQDLNEWYENEGQQLKNNPLILALTGGKSAEQNNTQGK